ncbi:MAG: dienelactone hydrolase family protein [Gammaproteobacteria bacterium]|nr:MAG: dienelactone hydrolase family protein [Gammaproteobacteria bacterium]|tara:strand:+ start:3825 stop:4526 length:702 start_codon:yes stop_codon:yes gene_type:complete
MSKEHAYEIDGNNFKGYFAQADSNKAPCVLIAHTWAGRDGFVEEKAEELAKLGYHSFALDMYGEGKIGTSVEENSSMMQPLLDDREELAKRVLGAYEYVKDLDSVESNSIAIMGYCFGGLVSLDLARNCSDLKGAVSFHGFLSGPEKNIEEKINAKVLALHGLKDPMVGQDQIDSFSNEMTEKNADWQLHVFGNAMHAFTNPEANDPGFGTVYNKEADERSWKMLTDLLKEIF